MRDIKFRAWNPTTKSMSKPFDLNAFRNGNSARNISWYGQTAIFLQYTGLKDKNGKEIYEGDSVDTGAGRIKVIVWENGAFHVRVPNWEENENMPTHPLYFRVISKDPVEIIGNIYENPDLLSKEQGVKATESKEKDG